MPAVCRRCSRSRARPRARQPWRITRRRLLGVRARRRVQGVGQDLQAAVWDGTRESVEAAVAKAKEALEQFTNPLARGGGLCDPAAIRLDLRGWLTEEGPMVDWVIPDWLPLGEVGVVAGAGASSKTYLLLHLAIGVASGTPICDGGLAGALWAPEVPRRVLFLSAEESEADLHRRFRRCLAAAGLGEESKHLLGQNLYVHSLRGLDNLLMMQSPTTRMFGPTAQAADLRRRAGRGAVGAGGSAARVVSVGRGVGGGSASALSALSGCSRARRGESAFAWTKPVRALVARHGQSADDAVADYADVWPDCAG